MHTDPVVHHRFTHPRKSGPEAAFFRDVGACHICASKVDDRGWCGCGFHHHGFFWLFRIHTHDTKWDLHAALWYVVVCVCGRGACMHMHPTGIHGPTPLVSIDGETKPQSGVLLLLCMDAMHVTSRWRPRWPKAEDIRWHWIIQVRMYWFVIWKGSYRWSPTQWHPIDEAQITIASLVVMWTTTYRKWPAGIMCKGNSPSQSLSLLQLPVSLLLHLPLPFYCFTVNRVLCVCTYHVSMIQCGCSDPPLLTAHSYNVIKNHNPHLF